MEQNTPTSNLGRKRSAPIDISEDGRKRSTLSPVACVLKFMSTAVPQNTSRAESMRPLTALPNWRLRTTKPRQQGAECHPIELDIDVNRIDLDLDPLPKRAGREESVVFTAVRRDHRPQADPPRRTRARLEESVVFTAGHTPVPGDLLRVQLRNSIDGVCMQMEMDPSRTKAAELYQRYARKVGLANSSTLRVFYDGIPVQRGMKLQTVRSFLSFSLINPSFLGLPCCVQNRPLTANRYCVAYGRDGSSCT